MNTQDPTEFAFGSLSPDLILDAIESIDLRVESGLLALNSYENRVYQFRGLTFDALREQKYVVKFYRPLRWTDQQIQEEHDFAFALQDAEVPIIAPLQFNNQSLHHYQGHRFAIYPCRGGRAFENDNLDHLEWMGRFIGRIHMVGQAFDFKYRPEINSQVYLHTAKQHIVDSQMIPPQLETSFFTILDMVIEKAQGLYQPQTNRALSLHGDCHAGNILWTDDGPHFVDLDDARTGPAVQDLWMMLSGDRQQQELQLDTMIGGYEEFCDFDVSELKLIEPLRALRMVHYMGWIANRWQDPAFPRNFAWFQEAKYWEQQILALKEQYAELNEKPIRLLSGM
ncbi:serine/threonine protein kinase [Saccharobesus litoralis]|uniref:Stress response kinase A n=1 Tax=Saccharobesus litoralis TaxID=2172099 RepID=A0A2S0VQR6_9ALTE|nr:serine/threonine protein kinase [Saccharobesus litoralis]AWB66557.1 serine/threonine protein kinase [Saccharobesus litoralis]